MSIEEVEDIDVEVDQDGESEAESEAEELEEQAEAPAQAEGGGAESEAERPAASQGGSGSGIYNAETIVEDVFEEMRMNGDMAEELRTLWRAFIANAGSPEAAGESIFAALFDAAPALQYMFKTPRGVMAMKIMNGWSLVISFLDDPRGLKLAVETLAFQHLDFEVTAERARVFRDAMVYLLEVEMGHRFTDTARMGFKMLNNYIGGAMIYCRTQYSERLRLIKASWDQVSKKPAEASPKDGAGEEEAEELAAAGGEPGGGEPGSAEAPAAAGQPPASGAGAEGSGKKKTKSKSSGWFAGLRRSAGGSGSGSGSGSRAAGGSGEGTDFSQTLVPTTYKDMFVFNSVVMGLSDHTWMIEVSDSFENIVENAANTFRLQEECDVLSLRMAKCKGTINLPQYKSVMLASLRSLVKDWGSEHEVAWSWLWENVEQMLKASIGRPAAQEKVLKALIGRFTEKERNVMRRGVFAKFFALAPAGQDLFKQSTTRLYFIIDKLLDMTLEMYEEPKRTTEDLSAIGLRHVGYGVPTDLVSPFVNGFLQTVRDLTSDDAAEEAFRWSMSLISRTITRVILEGSTLVMKAINLNSVKTLKKAISFAGRGERAAFMLKIQVGTVAISPLMWAIEAGALESARAILADLLTIRADRDNYYYSSDLLFERHPDIIQRLCMDAPVLMPVLLDGLIWRSRITEGGRRRVNYYIKHLLVGENGGFAKAIEWVTDYKDPKIATHPVVSLVTDMVWFRLAFRTFLRQRSWFIFTLLIFIASQSVLNRMKTIDSAPKSELPFEIRVAIFLCRCFVYIMSMASWGIFHVKSSLKEIRSGTVRRVGKRLVVPEYLFAWQGFSSLLLTVFLFLMLTMEPILHCLQDDGADLFGTRCAAAEAVLVPYSVVSTMALLLYFLLLADLAVFSTRVSAFALICIRVMSEVALFLFGLTFFVAAFACGISALEHDSPDFPDIPSSVLQLYKATLGMMSGDAYDRLLGYPALTAAIFLYITATTIFMLNLLIAQLNSAYQSTFLDMLGYARLNRGKIVVETMPSVGKNRWRRFVDELHLDEGVEFGEGDVGMAGGIQVWEPASANVTTVDMIRRFGGSTLPSAPWPEEAGETENDIEERFNRMEQLLDKAMKRTTGKKSSKKGKGTESDAASMHSGV